MKTNQRVFLYGVLKSKNLKGIIATASLEHRTLSIAVVPPTLLCLSVLGTAHV